MKMAMLLCMAALITAVVMGPPSQEGWLFWLWIGVMAASSIALANMVPVRGQMKFPGFEPSNDAETVEIPIVVDKETLERLHELNDSEQNGDAITPDEAADRHWRNPQLDDMFQERRPDIDEEGRDAQ